MSESPKPLIPHKNLTTGSGAPIMFWRMLADVCPQCGKGPSPARLAIYNEETPGVEQVGCLVCDYMINRPRERRLGPMNKS